MSKNKGLGLVSALAVGAGVAAVAAGKKYKTAETKKKEDYDALHNTSEYRNTERGKYEKNSKGIYYTNGNYEAFARPRKPEGVDDKHAYIVGNIGTPYTSVAQETTDDAVIVAEISSFQLETIHTFHPKVSAILNITPDHLNRHHTMEAYIEAKERIAENQTKADVCVLNYEDDELQKFGEKTAAQVLYFSSARKLEKGIYLDGTKIICAADVPVELCDVSELKILGTHNYENVMAASAMAYAYGVPIEVIRKNLLTFPGVEHRIEFVAEKRGVLYYNDSKGTNPDAAIKGIQAMNRPTILIGGGYDKDSEYDEWILSLIHI